jgi:hypothetical protein
LGEFSEEIRTLGIPVINDLRRLAEAPNIIHGHHFIQTAEALIHFPRTPAINVCHAWEYWVEQPPKFPQIQIYGAVSETVRDRLVHMDGIDPDKVVLLPNAVDLSRVPARPQPLSEAPQRALCFTVGKAHIPILRSACEVFGITLDTLGGCAGRFSASPEQELVNYDVVFATGRSAIEALCCGAAVIVCDARGLGGLVNSQNFERFRELNFALKTLTRPISIEAIVAELKEYDPKDAAPVSDRARTDCSFELLLDRVLDIYHRIIESWSQDQVEANAPASRKAILNFLYDALPRTSADTRWPWMVERDHLIRERDHLDGELSEERGQRISAEEKVSEERDQRLAAERELSEERNRRLAAENSLRLAECRALEAMDQLAAQRDRGDLAEAELANASALALSRLSEIGIEREKATAAEMAVVSRVTAAERAANARIAAAEAATEAAEQRARASETALSAIHDTAVWRLASPVHRFIEAWPSLHFVLRRGRAAAAFVLGRRRSDPM